MHAMIRGRTAIFNFVIHLNGGAMEAHCRRDQVGAAVTLQVVSMTDVCPKVALKATTRNIYCHKRTAETKTARAADFSVRQPIQHARASSADSTNHGALSAAEHGIVPFVRTAAFLWLPQFATVFAFLLRLIVCVLILAGVKVAAEDATSEAISCPA